MAVGGDRPPGLAVDPPRSVNRLDSIGHTPAELEEQAMPKEYESAKRSVVCYAQPLADGRFLGLVSIQTHDAGSVATIVHKCPGSDVTADDAIVRAKAWAHVHYPVD